MSKEEEPKKINLVDSIMRYEEGEMDYEEARAFLQHLHDTGMLNSLQGSYQRAYRDICCND